MHLPDSLLLLPVVTVIALAWFAWDMSTILKLSQRKQQLSIEGRWDDLERHYERTLKSRRPFVWLQHRYLLPGAVLAQYALFLYKRGRLEEALLKADRAIQQIEGKPKVFRPIYRSRTVKMLRGALHARTLILTSLGRYAEAREAADKAKQLPGSSESSNAALVLIEFYCGHLDEALAQAGRASPKDPQFESLRGIMALAHCMKGEFDQAIRSLDFEPGDISRFYSPQGMKTVSSVAEGAKLIELQRKKLAGVFPPIRLLYLAQIYLTQENFQKADGVLDRVEQSMGPEPAIHLSYYRHRACSFAAQGKIQQAQDCIGHLRNLAQQLPKRSTLWESHFSISRSYLYLGRFSDALAELTEAQRYVLHPIEKHATAYWVARAHDAAGDHSRAMECYHAVVADAIPSWMRKHAAEVIASEEG